MLEPIEHAGEKYLRIDPQAIDFVTAGTVHKVTDDYAVRETALSRQLDTIIDGHIETQKIAKRGDWLVYNIGTVDPATIPGYLDMNESEQVLARAQRAECYDPQPGTFEATHTIKHRIGDGVLASPKSTPRLAIQIPFNFILTAPWGSDEFVKAGGYICKEGEKIYGIAQNPFERTYGAIDQTRPFSEAHAAQIFARKPLVPEVVFKPEIRNAYLAAARAIRQKD